MGGESTLVVDASLDLEVGVPFGVESGASSSLAFIRGERRVAI